MREKNRWTKFPAWEIVRLLYNDFPETSRSTECGWGWPVF